MDKTLAEIYGTNQVEEADVEKLAAAELAEQLTETGDAQIDEETLEALAQEVLAQEDGSEEQAAVEEPGVEGEEKVAEADETEEVELTEEAQEKIAEADYLGRIMAHSFVQESREIEKQAMEKVADDVEVAPAPKKPIIAADVEGKGSASVKDQAKQNLRGAGTYTKNVAGRFGTALAGGRGASGVKERILGKAGQRTKVWGARGAVGAAAVGTGLAAKKLFGGKDKEKKSFALTDEGHKLDAKRYSAISRANHDAAKAEDEYASEAPVKASLLRPGQGAIHRMTARHADYAARKHEKGQNAMNPFGGYGTKSRAELAEKKEKKSSAIDTLAEQRALEVLAEAGYDVDAVVNAVQEYQAPEQEKVAEGAYDVLAETVEARAEEMLNGLVEAGIIALPEEQEQE